MCTPTLSNFGEMHEETVPMSMSHLFPWTLSTNSGSALFHQVILDLFGSPFSGLDMDGYGMTMDDSGWMLADGQVLPLLPPDWLHWFRWWFLHWPRVVASRRRSYAFFRNGQRLLKPAIIPLQNTWKYLKVLLYILYSILILSYIHILKMQSSMSHHIP